MITLKFSDTMAHAWFRTRLHRGSALCEDPSAAKMLLNLRERAYGPVVELSGDEAELALWFCEGKVGADPSLAEARQEIIDQIKEGLS